MKPLHTIVVTNRLTPVVKGQLASTSGKPAFAKAKLKHRFRAEFTSGPFKDMAVEGFLTAHEAVGALVRSTALLMPTAESVFELVATLFDNHQVRGSNETIGRALHFAARNPDRKHCGVAIKFADHLAKEPATAEVPEPVVMGKGGVA